MLLPSQTITKSTENSTTYSTSNRVMAWQHKTFPFLKLPKTTCGDQAHARFHSSNIRLQTITANQTLSRGGDWRVLQMQKILQFFSENRMMMTTTTNRGLTGCNDTNLLRFLEKPKSTRLFFCSNSKEET